MCNTAPDVLTTAAIAGGENSNIAKQTAYANRLEWTDKTFLID